MIKKGELTEDSYADDDPSKKAKYIEKQGHRVWAEKPDAEYVEDILDLVRRAKGIEE